MSEDARFLTKAVNSGEEDMEFVNPVTLEFPLSPLTASRMENNEIEIQKIREAYSILRDRHDFLIVEGVGGILVPIKKNYFVTDMVLEMELPLVIVARPNLGTINHTLLTIREAERSGLTIKGIIFNYTSDHEAGPAEKTNPGIIEELSGIPFLGTLPYDSEINVSSLDYGGLTDLTLKSIDIDRLLS